VTSKVVPWAQYLADDTPGSGDKDVILRSLQKTVVFSTFSLLRTVCLIPADRGNGRDGGLHRRSDRQVIGATTEGVRRKPEGLVSPSHDTNPLLTV